MEDPIGEESLRVMSKASWYNLWIFEQLKPHLGEKVFEVGSGIGNFTKLISKNTDETVASDIRKGYLVRLRKTKGKNTKVIYADVEKPKYSSEVKNFSSIVCLNVLEHIKDDQKTLNNFRKILRKKGRLLLLVPAHMAFYGQLDKGLGHYRRYNKKNLSKKIKKAGFKIVSIKYLNALAGLGWFLNARVLNKKVISTSNITIFSMLARPFLFLEKFIEPPFGLSVFVIAEK